MWEKSIFFTFVQPVWNPVEDDSLPPIGRKAADSARAAGGVRLFF